MRVGILGSGRMGAKLGTIWARAGHDVVFSYSRDARKLARLARETKGQAGTPADAARYADALLLAVHWSRVDDVLDQAGDLSGKTMVTCSLPMNADDTELVVAHTSSGAEELGKKIPGAHIVSAFGTVPSVAPMRPEPRMPMRIRQPTVTGLTLVSSLLASREVLRSCIVVAGLFW